MNKSRISFKKVIKVGEITQLEDMYGSRVNSLVRQKYSQDEVEAIIANYLSYLSGDTSNPAYKTEYSMFQNYRQECKEIAKKEI